MDEVLEGCKGAGNQLPIGKLTRVVDTIKGLAAYHPKESVTSSRIRGERAGTSISFISECHVNSLPSSFPKNAIAGQVPSVHQIIRGSERTFHPAPAP